MKKTLVGLLLDRTGSMETVKEQTIEGVNEFLQGLKSGKGIRVSVVTFNSWDKFYIEYEDVKPKNAKQFTSEDYKPMSQTPLLDSVAAMIHYMEQLERKWKRKGKVKVLVAIMTDGEENDSREYTNHQISDLINKKRKKGWEFAFLGADQDAFAVAHTLGISRLSTRTYTKGAEVGTLSGVASAAVSYSMGETQEGRLFSDVDDRVFHSVEDEE